jgi:hypothetical protein
MANTPVNNPALPEEERKALSRKRIFWALIGVDVIIAVIFLYEVIDLFVR